MVFAGLDRFRGLMDAYSPTSGDAVHGVFASLFTANLGEGDMVARYARDQFAFILPERDLMAAYNPLIKIKYACNLSVRFVASVDQPLRGLTASCGLACGEPGMTASAVTEQADVCMRGGRKSGRNFVKARGIG